MAYTKHYCMYLDRHFLPISTMTRSSAVCSKKKVHVAKKFSRHVNCYNLMTCLFQLANCNNLQAKADEAYAMSKLISNQHKIPFSRKENIKTITV